MIDRYYDEELRYLYESGKAFARAHPDRARFLDIDAVGDRDPYIERLFEGFAFLAGRIREKLDDTFPELTEGLVNLLWPQFLQEIPSLSIVEFKPRKGHLQETRSLEAGSLLLSTPAGQNGIVCRFSTTSRVAVSPIWLHSIEKEVDTRGTGSMRLNFCIETGVKWQNLDLDPLRLYIHSEPPTALAVHELLTRHVKKTSVRAGDEKIAGGTFLRLCPGGFSPEESLLLSSCGKFRNIALLQEYFVYPEKFYFVNILGIGKNLFHDSVTSFSIELDFDCDFPCNKPFDRQAFRLFCSPVVNMFKKDTEPVINNGRSADFQVCADYHDRSSLTHSIISVTGTDRKTGSRVTYEPSGSFRGSGNKEIRTFCPHYCQGFDNRRELYITLNGNDSGESHDENLSIEAWCTNGVLPREELREGSICKPGQDFPDFVMFSNITRPTLPFLPPENSEYLWVFLSHMAATYKSFSSAESLKTFLKLYDWSKSGLQERKIEAIVDLAITPVESMYKGSIVRGLEFCIFFQDSEFMDRGDLNLFGEVLREFLTRYISINSFLEFVIKTRPSGKELRWNSLRGNRWPI